MSLKDIIVHLDGSLQSASRLKFAVELSRQHDAHLIGVFGHETLSIQSFIPATEAGFVDDEEIVAAQEKYDLRIAAAAARARAALEDRAGREGVSFEWRELEVTTDYLSEAAYYADLVVVPQTDPDGGASAGPQAADFVLTSGRPTLIVPDRPSVDSIAQRVLVAWKPGRVAARAVADALPLLVKADVVTVLTVNLDENTQGPRPGADLAEHLARHGVKADVVRIANSDADAGEIILSEAGERHADLVVMGGYATSRMREFLLGGATRHVIAKSTIPVLMSH